jgi:hypothetical protein
MRIFLPILLLAMILIGCNTARFNASKTADTLAEKRSFTKKLVKGGEFWFTTYQKITRPDDPIVIYIEGDGRILANRYVISSNPTPTKPLFINLAFSDPRPNIVYLARPCQYTPMNLNSQCNNTYWTNKRYSEDSIDAINQAINKITNNNNFELVGYSGGGGVAILIAARNKSVNSILTIAANLDIDSFTKYHKSAPMISSLNPIDYVNEVKNIPQLHFSGGKDKIVPAFIGEKFVSQITTGCARHEILPDAEHARYWKSYWDYVLNSTITCSKKNL